VSPSEAFDRLIDRFTAVTELSPTAAVNEAEDGGPSSRGA